MDIGKVYELVDIYSIDIEDRLAVVGGFRPENSTMSTSYVWLPASLCRNFDKKKVLQLKASIKKGKKGRAVYKGLKSLRYGTPVYDMEWVAKK